MIGAILGDVVGSIYEFDNIKTKDFELFDKECMFTDDSVMTIAVAEALMEFEKVTDDEAFKEVLIKAMHKYGRLYPDASYGGRFLVWLLRKSTQPYNSFGNGSAMRVSPVGWYAKTLPEAEKLAELTALVTHNHPEGIKGAVVTAGAIFLGRMGKSKEEIRGYIEKSYPIDFTLDEIRPTYKFNETCQETVPQALAAFLESESFEDAIRNAVSLGGDGDTQACIAGAIAEAFYGIPDELAEEIFEYIDDDLQEYYCEYASELYD